MGEHLRQPSFRLIVIFIKVLPRGALPNNEERTSPVTMGVQRMSMLLFSRRLRRWCNSPRLASSTGGCQRRPKTFYQIQQCLREALGDETLCQCLWAGLLVADDMCSDHWQISGGSKWARYSNRRHQRRGASSRRLANRKWAGLRKIPPKVCASA
jgi:hypothetical protein